LSRMPRPLGESSGRAILKNPVPSTEVLTLCLSKMARASRTVSTGCTVLYLPQMLRTSAQCRWNSWRNLAATFTSSSISSVVTPSLILESSAAVRRVASAAIAGAARKWRRVVGFTGLIVSSYSKNFLVMRSARPRLSVKPAPAVPVTISTPLAGAATTNGFSG
jgi:hypothetical protein